MKTKLIEALRLIDQPGHGIFGRNVNRLREIICELINELPLTTSANHSEQPEILEIYPGTTAPSGIYKDSSDPPEIIQELIGESRPKLIVNEWNGENAFIGIDVDDNSDPPEILKYEIDDNRCITTKCPYGINKFLGGLYCSYKCSHNNGVCTETNTVTCSYKKDHAEA